MLAVGAGRFRTLLTIAGVLIAIAVVGCGGGSRAGGGNGAGVVPEPYDTVTPDASLGEGSNLTIRGARSTADNALEVLVDGFSCGGPSRVDVEETAVAIVVAVRGALIGEGDCPANIVPWFVPVELVDPLADRVVATREGDRFRVVDCQSSPQHRLCDPPR